MTAEPADERVGDQAAGLDDVLADLERSFDFRLDELADYVRIPSVSAENRGVQEAAEHICARATSWGLTARTLPTPGQPAVLINGPHRRGTPHVLIYGHYDVQPAGARSSWGSEPFTTTIRAGRIYGRGTADNKGQHLAHLLAMRSWLRVTGSLPCTVTVLLDGEEEVGSPNLADLVRTHREDLACDLVLWSDGPVHESGRSRVKFGVRGIASFDLVARGANVDLHSGNWGGVAANPAWELIHLLASMRDADGSLTVPGLTDDVSPPTDAEAAALAALPVPGAELAALGIDRLDGPDGRGFYERLASHPTLSVNALHTGSEGEDRAVIPAYARARCDVRLVEAMTVQGTLDCIKAHVARQAPRVEVRPVAAMEPSRTDPGCEWTAPVARALHRVQGREPLLVPAMGGSLPDYVFTKILGVPSLGVPFANADECNHAPNENIELDRFREAPAIAATLLAELAAAGEVR